MKPPQINAKLDIYIFSPFCAGNISKFETKYEWIAPFLSLSGQG